MDAQWADTTVEGPVSAVNPYNTTSFKNHKRFTWKSPQRAVMIQLNMFYQQKPTIPIFSFETELYVGY